MTLCVNEISYRTGKSLLLDRVSMSAPAGAMTGLLGPNGSGKSTLLKLLAGAIPPSNGSVTLNGQDLFALKRRDRARFIALVEQDARTELPLTVQEAVSLGRFPHRSFRSDRKRRDDEIVELCLEALDLTQFRNRVLSSLSGGQRQRAQIARALAQEPDLLLLDEPTNHLDIHAQLQLLEHTKKLAQLGVTVIIALHDIHLAAQYCDHLVVLNQGEVVSTGTPDMVVTSQLLNDTFKVRSEIFRHPDHGGILLNYNPPG